MIPVKFLKDSFSESRILPDFYKNASELRAHFDARFSDPYRASSDRFCWDYWSVHEQYRLLRSPASSFFPKELYQGFLNHLLDWGRKTLGCQMISHPWLSAYIDGSYQRLHSDVPHGPFSFVYSLTDWKQRKFKGGETILAKPTLLRYFSEIDFEKSHEEKDFLQKIAPKFNQLTLFDPRYPHGVERVSGVESILDSRLVIHGWFTEPRPMLAGTLDLKKVSKPLDQLAESLLSYFGTLPFKGLLSVRFKVLPSGKIDYFEVLSSHLLDGLGNVIPKKLLCNPFQTLEITFPKSSGSTFITLPLQIYH